MLVKAFLVLLSCTLLSAARVDAQSVAGVVTTNDGSPLVNATISLLSATDSAWLRSEVTGPAGRYTLSAESGNYLLQATAEGYGGEVKPCTLSKDAIAAADFRLASKTIGLGDVVVAVKRPFVEGRPGMLVVNVEASAVSAGNNALELLRRSPGVQVSPQGGISMRGKAGVQVYIDGRPSRLSGNQLTAYLTSMTAEEVAQTELITQPSAKYEAAGTAGIINIRTRAVRGRGLNGNFSATATRATRSFGNPAPKGILFPCLTSGK